MSPLGILEDIGAFLIQNWSNLTITGFTAVVALIAVLTFLKSIRGARINVALEDPIKVNARYSTARIRFPQIPSGTTQELYERLEFEFPLVWTNSGPVGGAITNVELRLTKPANIIPTVRNGVASEDMIFAKWRMDIANPEERVPLNSVRLPIFELGSQNSMSIAANENIVVIAKVQLFIVDKEKETNPPFNTWKDIAKATPYFEFKLRWKRATKKTMKLNERSFTVQPNLGMPLQETPAIT